MSDVRPSEVTPFQVTLPETARPESTRRGVTRRTVLIGAAVSPDEADALSAALAEHVRHRHPGTEFNSYRTGHRGDLVFIGVE